MPSTPIYGLPFEKLSDQSGHSLHGGTSGTEAILAEKVEDELERVDQGLSTVKTDVARGWRPITSDTGSGVFNIDLTADGTYPAGTFEMIKLYFRGWLTTESYLQMRVNNDSTANLHQRSSLLFSAVDGSVIEAHEDDGTTWRLAQWGSSFANVAEATIFNTDVSSILAYEATGSRMQSGGTSLRRRTLAHGRLASNRELSSLQIFPIVGEIDTCRYWAEGFRS